MKAVLIHRFGPAEVLELTDTRPPLPGPQDVLIDVKAAGLNPVDTKIRAGTHRSSSQLSLPAVLGKEVSGTVVAAAESTGLVTGDAVLAFLPANGGFAERAVAPAQLTVKKPGNASFQAAAAAPLAGMTAYQAIHEHLGLAPGQRILIQAGAGGVGHLAVQFAKMAGAHVSATASAKNHDFLRQLGVDIPIDYKKERFEEKVTEVDAVLDAMGGEVLYRSIACLKPGGRAVCLPSATKDDPKALELARERNVHLVWPMMHPEREQLLLIAKLLERDELHVEIDKAFPLADIAEAHKAVESHGTTGKNIILVNGTESAPN